MQQRKEFSWKSFEEELFGECLRTLSAAGREHEGETFYVVALYGVYRELDGLLSLPHLAANTVERAPEADRDGFWGRRWNPEDWELTELPLRETPALRLERALTAEAKRSSQNHWRKTEARYTRVLVRLARRLRDAAPDVIKVNPDFVAFWHDAEGGPELARRTIPKSLFERLFPANVAAAADRAAMKTGEPTDRAVALVERFGCFEGITQSDAIRELLTLGEEAVPPLLAKLEHPRHGVTAAQVLTRLGIGSPQVLKALRPRATSGDFPQAWYATALGALGDHEWLFGRQDQGVAVAGLTASLKAITWQDVTPAPLDYRHLERYLDRGDEEVSRLTEQALAPGSSYVRINADDVAEAVRGLTSDHAVIRWHAAAVLGNRGLGKLAGKNALPALADALSDPHPVVRRLAVLSITWWKAAAKPYLPRIAELTDDPDESVRSVVARALG